MKKNTVKRKNWHAARARNEFRRKHRHTVVFWNRKQNLPLETKATRVESPPRNAKAAVWRATRGQRRIRANLLVPPADFSLREHHYEVASFFFNLRHQIYNHPRVDTSFGIDFGALNSLSPGAGLLLAAELYRWQKNRQRKLVAIRQDEWSPYIAAMLDQLGLFELLDTPNRDRSLELNQHPEISFIPYSSGHVVSGEDCALVQDRLAEIAGPLAAQTFVYDGLVEAIKNVKLHAYTSDSRWFGVEEGRWFMCGAFEDQAKILSVAVYDLGIGIPATLPRSSLWEQIRGVLEFIGQNDDASMIAAAMQVGRSRSDFEHRGKGLPIMMRLIDTHGGYLRILSGKGEAIYSAMNSSEIRKLTHDIPIVGTLIEWQIGK